MVIIIVILVSLCSLLVAKQKKNEKQTKRKHITWICRSGFSHGDEVKWKGGDLLGRDFIGTQKTIKGRKSLSGWVSA